MSRLVCVAPNPAIDRFYEVGRLVPGTIHRPTQSSAVAGGKGLNAARAAQALGADVVAVAILRGHAGAVDRGALAEHGLRLRAAWAKGETRTCVSIRDPATDGLTEIYDRGEPLSLSDWEAMEVLVAEELAAGGEMVTISGGSHQASTTKRSRDLSSDARRSREDADRRYGLDSSVLGIGVAREDERYRSVGPARTAGRDRKPGAGGGCRDPSPGAEVSIVTMERSGAVARCDDELVLPARHVGVWRGSGERSGGLQQLLGVVREVIAERGGEEEVMR